MREFYGDTLLCKQGICATDAEIPNFACWWLPPPNPRCCKIHIPRAKLAHSTAPPLQTRPATLGSRLGCEPFRRFSQNTLSSNSGQLLQNFVGALPEFFLSMQYLLHVLSVNPTGGIDVFGDLIEIIISSPQERNHFPQLRQLQLYHITVNRHLAEIRTHADDAGLLYFRFYHVFFFWGYAKAEQSHAF